VRELLEFIINESYTPDTLPMARLAEYLTDLSMLLGEKERVHFVQLDEGSAKIVHAVEEVAIPKVRARVAAARVADAESEERHAFENIDHRLRQDNATGILREAGPPDGGRLLFFPGKSRNIDPIYGPFSEQGQLYGIVIGVGGKQRIVNINIQDGEKIYYCEASRDIALQLAPLMFHYPIRVFGTGRYLRNPDGQWEMKSFRISQHEKLDRRPLAETVERLRGITRRVGLDRDIIKKLADLRNDPSEA
jgi:hypothetical protein